MHELNAYMQNVVDGAITVGAWFFFGYALYGDGSAFGGHKVSLCSPLLFGVMHVSLPCKGPKHTLSVSYICFHRLVTRCLQYWLWTLNCQSGLAASAWHIFQGCRYPANVAHFQPLLYVP